MKKISQEQLLMEHIEYLQMKQDSELLQLKSQLHSITPLSLIKSFVFSNDNATDTKPDLINTVVNITSRFLSRNAFLSRFENPIKSILGNILQRFIQ